MSSSTTPPDPYGTGDHSSGSGSSDAAGGSTSSGYGSSSASTPPPYGSPPPPPSGSTSPYDSTPPAYGSTPPAYGSSPSYGSDYGSGAAGYGYSYPKNSLGVWSLVLGLVGIFVCGLLAGIPAIVVGHKARGAIAEGQANNGGMATAGIVLGWVSVALSILGVLLFVLLAATGALAGLSTVPTSEF